ncbi:MAG: M48 family metallopeptidase [Candidatus Rariloculaceae bacterium]
MSEQLNLLEDGPTPSWHSHGQPVSIRESRRAKRLILQMIPPCTLEVVVPRGTRPRDVEIFLRENQNWIDRAQHELRERYPESRLVLPELIELPAIGRRWDVRYTSMSGARPRLRHHYEHLELTTPDSREDEIRGLLREWLLEQGRRYLKPWLLAEAKVVGVQPNKVQVRTQRTRWGSCSPRGNISLNASLLFVERPLARYLLIHELCHLHHLDHSRRYWRAVEAFEPDYRVLDKQLTESWSDVPIWALGH